MSVISAHLINQSLQQGVAPDSENALNVLMGKETKDRDFVIQQNLDNTLAIIKDDWKYIEPSDAPSIEFWTKIELGNNPKQQLYKIKEDIREQKNLADKYPERAKKLASVLDSVKQIKSL